MFYLYQSNRVERLFAELTRVLVQSESGPLQQEMVVVENPGLAHWVKMQLAQALGIAANIEFPMPSRFFWQIQRLVMPDLAGDSIFAKDSLTWLIYDRLPNLIDQPEFSGIAHYLHSSEDTDTSVVERRRFQLAGQIADLYDQYLVYRPDWIEQWSLEGESAQWKTLDDEPLAETQYWQPILWQDLLEHAQQQGLPISHRASMLREFMEQLKVGKRIPGLPKQVVFFGFSALPKHQLETLSLLSQHMDVHLMVPNPCQYYWGDVLDEKRQAQLRMRGQQILNADAGNALLASFGRMGQEFQRLLLDVDHVQEQQAFYDDGQDSSLLHEIQDQILNLHQAETAEHKKPISKCDDSVQVVGCHSPMREVEVLHDHLLDLFQQASEQGSPLNPQDIVVMIPDVAAYAPYIDAVFSQPIKQTTKHTTKEGETLKLTIPYSISDRPVQAEHPLLTAFSNLLHLPFGRFALSDVLALLETPAVYRAYELDEHDLPLLRQWLQDAGVRWGLNGEQRLEKGLLNWSDNTWLDGFKRLLMGYAVAGPEPVFGTIPVSGVEGLSTRLLGHLISFVEDLSEFSQQSQQSRSVQQWSQWLNLWINKSFSPDDQEQTLIQHIVNAIEHWVDGAQRVHFDQLMNFVLVADGLKQRLQQRSGSQHFMVGKVNFCTLLPMRSIPFKVVAVLGLNDSDYPRHVPPRAFDLMSGRRRLGDRSRRDEDRYLFLEAIVSARDSLWLSYRSRNQKSNEDQTASVVLAEFMDFVRAGFYCEGDENEADPIQQENVTNNIFMQHPLQPFNKQYFLKNSSLFSYHQDWYQVHAEDSEAQQTDVNSMQTTTKFENAEIELDELIRFWQAPCRYYLNKALDVHLSLVPELDDEDEPFALDGLDQFSIKQTWLTADKDVVSDSPSWIAAGRLAFGEIGERQLQSTLNSVNELKTIAQSLMGEKLPPREVRLSFNINSGISSESVLLQGWLKNIYSQPGSDKRIGQQVMVNPSKLKGRHVTIALIQHCAMNAMGIEWPTYLLCQDQAIKFVPMKASDAKNKLHLFVDYLLQGMNAPLPYLVNTGWQFHNPKHKSKHEVQAEKAFIGISSPAYSEPGERDDVHVRRCFNLLNEIPKETVHIAQQLFEDLIQTESLLSVSLEELLERSTLGEVS